MDIVEKKIPITLSGKATIYEPPTRRLKGEDDDGVYYADFKLPDPPAGNPLLAPGDPTVIAWDESFYIYWEATSAVDYYTIEIKDGATTIATFSTEGLFYKFTDTEAGITNDTEYSATVSGTYKGDVVSADPVNFTPSEKIPTNLTEVSRTGSSFEFSWDEVTDVKDYIIYLTNEDTSTIVQEIIGIESNSTTIFGLEEDVNYSVQVTSRSSENIFVSAKSSKLEFIITDAPDAPTNILNTTINISTGWTTHDPININISAITGAYNPNDELIYLARPQSGSTYLNSVFTFNPETEEFINLHGTGTTGNGAGTPRYYYNGNIIIPTIYTNGAVLLYNISTGLSTQIYNNTSLANGDTALDSENGLLYMLNGQFGDVNDFYVLDLDTEVATQLSPLSVSMYGGQAGFFDGEVYHRPSGSLNLYVYDPITDSHTQKNDLPNAGLVEYFFEYREKLHIYTRGGSVYVYDKGADSWTDLSLGTVEHALFQNVPALVEDKLWLFGGVDGSSPTNYVQSVNINAGETNALIEWDVVTGVDGYNVYVSIDGGAYVKDNETLITDLEYLMINLADGDYDVYVTASLQDIESEASTIVEFSI